VYVGVTAFVVGDGDDAPAALTAATVNVYACLGKIGRKEGKRVSV
jgi:hypothetical protein